MKRDLATLDGREFDLAVIGGGVVGASIARDAARRGLSVALIEKDDFAAAASEAMSHLVHGGIRYLAQAQLGMVRQSLAERAVWRTIAPLHVRAQPCLMPIAGKGMAGTAVMRSAVGLFNLLGGREGAPAGSRSWLDAKAAVAAEPALEMPALAGALAWHDCRVDEPERVVLTLVKDAAGRGAAVANHLECTKLVTRNGRLVGVAAEDRINGGRVELRVRAAVNATGPWAAVLAGQLLSGQKAARLTVSKGIHLVVGPIVQGAAINLTGKGEHGFVLPWRGLSLIGTSDEPVDAADGGMVATESEVTALKQKIARLLPAVRLALDQIIGTYASARALPGAMHDTYRAARDEAIADHAADGAAGFFSVYGGKWTTSRRVAEQAVDRVAKALDARAKPCETRQAKLPGTPDGDTAVFRGEWLDRLKAWPPDEAESWIAAYGTALPQKLAALPDTADASTRETVRFAIAAEEEMAVVPEDFARRLARWHGLTRPGVAARAAEWLARKTKVADARLN
jgi:glycerol-3-phosphate dehydrogenase